MKKNRAKIRWTLQSAVFRIVFLTIILILPINLITLFMSTKAIAKIENQISTDIQNALELNMNQMDYLFKTINRRLYNLSMEDEDYIWLMTKVADNDEEFTRQMKALIRLRITMNEIKTNYPWIDNTFVYFPKKNYFIYNNSYDGIIVKKMVLESIYTESEENLGQWVVIEGEKNLLVRIVKYHDSYYGACIDLENLLVEMSQEDSENVTVFVTEEGNIISQDKELLGLDLIKEGETVKYHNEKYIIVNAHSTMGNLVLVEMISRDTLKKSLPGYIRAMRYVVLLALLFIPILIWGFVRWMVRPIMKLVDGMSAVEKGNLEYRIEEKTYSSEFNMINRNFNTMMNRVLELKINVYEKEIERQNIRMQYLSQQIQPHFILNAMNIIYSYEPEEYELIQKMVLYLSKYYQFIVNANKPYVKIKYEFEHIDNYLKIQKIRYAEKMEYEIFCDKRVKDALMPPLIIQSLTENIIKYALKDDEVVYISLKAEMNDEVVKIILVDTGFGIPEEMQKKVEKFMKTGKSSKGMGIGLQNTIERLSIFFEGKAKFRINKGELKKGTIVELEFPLVKEPVGEEE